MIKILFICHGNICRSPMAEYIMKTLVTEAGLSHQVAVASAATSTEELGNPVYPPARRKLAEHGISCAGHHARQINRQDYSENDLLIGMDSYNLRNMQRMTGGDPDGKVHLLLEDAPHPRSVADPWYTDDFETAYQDILEGCELLLQKLRTML